MSDSGVHVCNYSSCFLGTRGFNPYHQRQNRGAENGIVLPKVTELVRDCIRIQNPGEPDSSPPAEMLCLVWGQQRLPRPGWRLPRATHQVLVEVVHHHPGQPRVAPVAMHQQQLLEVSEVGDGEVAGHDGLWGRNRDSASIIAASAPRGSPRAGLCSRALASRLWKAFCPHVVPLGGSFSLESKKGRTERASGLVWPLSPIYPTSIYYVPVCFRNHARGLMVTQRVRASR